MFLELALPDELDEVSRPETHLVGDRFVVGHLGAQQLFSHRQRLT
jgi:hypothetical protein